MIALLARLGLSQRLAEKMAPWVLAAALCLSAAAGLAIWVHFHDRGVVKADRQAANLEQLQGQVKADAAAADQRLEDAVTNRQQQEAYHDAIDNPKPGEAVDPGVRLACERLRRDGQNTAAIPACAGR